MSDELGNRIREAREAKQWTQGELAERMGVSRKTVNTVENGRFTPSTVVALKFAAALGAGVESLFWLADPPTARGTPPTPSAASGGDTAARS